VVALVVVLDEDLPVGRDLVVMLPGHHQPFRFIGRDQFIEGAERVR